MPRQFKDWMRWALSPQHFIGAIVVAVIAALITPPIQGWLNQHGSQPKVKIDESSAKDNHVQPIPNVWRKFPPDAKEVTLRIQAGEWIVGDVLAATYEEAFRYVAKRDFDSDVWHFPAPYGSRREIPESVKSLWTFYAQQQPTVRIVSKNSQKLAIVNGREWGGSYIGIRAVTAWQNDTITAVAKRGTRETVVVNEVPWDVWFDAVEKVAHRHGHTAALVVDGGRRAIFSDGRRVGNWTDCGLFGWGCDVASEFDARGRLPPRIQKIGSQYRIYVGKSQWQLLFEGVSATAIGPEGMVSARVRIANKWTYVVDQRVLPEYFDEANIWTISSDGKFLSAAVADRQPDGSMVHRLIVRKIPTD